MARPIKESMPYFSHDTDVRGKRKIKLFLASTGLPGYGFMWAVIEDGYNNSYYCPWTQDDQHLFAASFTCPFHALSREDVSYITQQAIERNVFDKTLFENHQILTSATMQERYLKQSSRRILVEMRSDWALIDLYEFYETELKSSTVSLKIVDAQGKTIDLLGDFKNHTPAPKKEPEPAKPAKEYDTKYDFNSTDKWDGEQPIDYAGCVELWNKINGCNLRVTSSKRNDLKRVFRQYVGVECLHAMMIRRKDETLSASKYLTQWDTLFGAKKFGNLDKWVDRGREWLSRQETLQSVDDHKQAGWMLAKEYEKVCSEAGIDFEDSMFCNVKKVENSMMYYPKFSY